MTFCAPAPGCKLVCDPFGIKPLPPPLPGPDPVPAPGPTPGQPQPQPQPTDPAAGVAGAIAGPAEPMFGPFCAWQCLPPPPPPPPPLKKCSASGQCASGEVCDLIGCGPGAAGLCVPKPEACTADYSPVCGCDGKTYGNNCGRVAAGVGLDHKGECNTVPPPPPPPPPCCKSICPDPNQACPAVCDPSSTCTK